MTNDYLTTLFKIQKSYRYVSCIWHE